MNTRASHLFHRNSTKKPAAFAVTGFAVVLAAGALLAFAAPRSFAARSYVLLQSEAPPASPGHAEGGKPVKEQRPAALAFAPLSYFEEKCARCHGPYGSFYGEGFGRTRDDAGLKQVVKEMAEGPAQAPLAPEQLEALTAYHRSLADKRPFLIVNEVVNEAAQEGGEKEVQEKAGAEKTARTLRGEVTPGATVKLVWGKSEAPVKVEGHVWTAALPAGIKLSAVQVVAENDGGRTVIEPAVQPYSHTPPNPAPPYPAPQTPADGERPPATR